MPRVLESLSKKLDLFMTIFGKCNLNSNGPIYDGKVHFPVSTGSPFITDSTKIDFSTLIQS